MLYVFCFFCGFFMGVIILAMFAVASEVEKCEECRAINGR